MVVITILAPHGDFIKMLFRNIADAVIKPFQGCILTALHPGFAPGAIRIESFQDSLGWARVNLYYGFKWA